LAQVVQAEITVHELAEQAVLVLFMLWPISKMEISE
jgi:hypothetical protein